jgi:hypothetical protein
MEHRPALGQVDLLAGEERRDPVRQADRIGGAHQRGERRRIEAFLRDVDAPVVPVECQRLGAIGLACEQGIEARDAKPSRVHGEVDVRRVGLREHGEV